MYEDFYIPYDQAKLWTRNLVMLSVSNFLLYASVYLMLPALLLWTVQFASCSYAEAGAVLALFGVGLFLPGVFNSYLIEVCQRQRLALLTLALLAGSHLLFPSLQSLTGLAGLRLGQGALFSILTMTTGSTLVIDVTASRRRTEANAVFAWSGRFGTVAGLLAGLYLEPLMDFTRMCWVAAAMGGVACLPLLSVSVPFRAPLCLRVVSMDRFLSLRAALPGLNLLMLASVFGVLVARSSSTYFFACLAVGLLLALLLVRFVARHLPERAEVELGQAALMGGFLLLALSNSLMSSYVASLLLGVGIGTTASRFLVQMVSLPLHCGRGTGNNTYQLLWEAGVAGGFCAGTAWIGSSPNELYWMCLGVSAALLLLYEALTHPWVKKQMEENN